MGTTTIPNFVERDPAVIMAEAKAQLEGFLGRELQPAQVEQLLLQFVVYRETLLLNRFNAGMSQMLYQFSTAPVIDYIAALVAVERLPEAYAGCTVRFILVPGHGTVVIPEGTRVATSDSQVIFEVADDIIIASNINSVDVSVIAQNAGKSANGYALGTVNKILDPLAFVSTVSNITVTGGGSDEETDDALRERIRLAPSQFSTAGSTSSYIFHAKSANAGIIDVSVTSPVPGTVMIVPLAGEDTGGYDQLITDVYNACSPDTVRPLTDTVIVVAPNQINYTIDVNLIVYDNYDIAEVTAKVTAALNDYAAEKAAKLGKDIVRLHIGQICRIAEVYDAILTSPANKIEVAEDEVPVCTEIKVTVIGSTNG